MYAVFQSHYHLIQQQLRNYRTHNALSTTMTSGTVTRLGTELYAYDDDKTISFVIHILNKSPVLLLQITTILLDLWLE
jgi:hypothetical protein